MSGSLPPCRVAGEFLEQVFPCGGKFVSDEAQPEEPAPEGVFRVIGNRARGAGGLAGQRLCADGEAQLDIRLYLACVECAVEGPELNGVRRSLGRKGRVEVEQMISTGVVVLLCAPPPVGACTAGAGVPEPGEGFHRRGLAPVQLGEEPRLNRAAPACAPFGRNAQGHGQQVFLGVYDIHQPAQALRGVLAEADVDVDAAGAVGFCARRQRQSVRKSLRPRAKHDKIPTEPFCAKPSISE